MRDPRTYQPNRLPDFWDLIQQSEPPPGAAPAMASAAAPPPTVGSRIADLAGGIGSAVAAPVRALGAPFRALGQAYDTEMTARSLKNEGARLANERAAQEARLADAQFPAQESIAAAQARQQAELTQRIAQAQDPTLRESLIRGAATGEYRPFHVEPGPAELAAYQQVLGMQTEEARQRLIGQREQQQARLDASLTRQTTTERLAGELELEKSKRALGPETAGINDVRAIRSEFEGLPQVKNFAEVRQAYKIIQALPATKAGDLTLLVKYMKLIDPSSSVREGELATADKAGGVPAWLIAQYNTLRESGGRLAPTIRDDFVQRAGDLYGSYLGTQRNLEGQYSEIARRRGIDPRDVVTDFVGKDEAPAAPRKMIGGHEYEKAEGGWKLVQ